MLRVDVFDRRWEIAGVDSDDDGRISMINGVSGVGLSRHDGRRAALDALDATLVTGLRQVRDWRGSL